MKRKTIVLLVALAAMLALPTTMSAQIDEEGGLFSKKTTEQNNGLLALVHAQYQDAGHQ